ncbi:MAG: hypothetical protein FWC91_14420 [Defluviitaleaceae bacterium]|nr:hypothetical protein [Defluviitaleaceae bacterium]
MASFNTIERRLLMRYTEGSPFNFNKVRFNAPDEAVHRLATTFASVQSDQPTRISTVVTRQLVLD